MTHLTEEKIFFVSCIIESYKRRHRLNGEQVLALFDTKGVQEWLYDNYEALHTVSEEYVMDKIDVIS